MAQADQTVSPEAVLPEKLPVEVNVTKDQNDKEMSPVKGRGVFMDYLRIFSYATKGDIILLAMGSAASIGAGIALPLTNIVFGKLATNFTTFGTQLDTGPDAATNAIANAIHNFTSDLNQYTLYLVYIFIGKFVLTYIAMFSFRITGIRLSAAIRLDYLKALFSQSISRLDKLPVGQSSTMITASANTLQIGISEKLSTCLQFTALLISAYAIAFIYSWQLTLVASSVLLFVVAVFSIVIPISLKLQKAVDEANEKSSSTASEVFSAIRMVVACGAEQRVVKSFGKWTQESRRRGLKLSPVLGIQFAPIFFAVFADFALVFWYGSKLYQDRHIDSVGTVLVVLMSVMMSVFSLSNIIVPLNAAVKAGAAATNFFAMIDGPRLKLDGLQDPDASAAEDISFSKVTFAYPSRPDVKILDELDVSFDSGKLTAIVGPSGSGKSTVVGLIERWYEIAASNGNQSEQLSEDDEKPEKQAEESDKKPDIELSGSITVGKHNINELKLKWWRSQIGLVQQEPFIFNDTIYKNVAQGLVGSKFENEDEESKRRRVEEACQEAFADEFITRLPSGYDTKVGDSGIKLSGGQRQRIAIARSIIKRPTILIFDEATSAIDVRGERIVQEAMDRVAKNRTTITIAHRLSTIKKADKIVVVAKGKVVEQGTHEELLNIDDGVYFNLVNAQSLAMTAEVDELMRMPSAGLPAEDAFVLNEVSSKEEEDTAYERRGFLRSFGLLLVEQKHHIMWLLLTIFGALGAATAFPIQAYLFAHLISVFQVDRSVIVDAASYWALRFTILAIGIGTAYFLVGWAANSLAHHVSSTYRLEYFENMTKKPIEFFDADENSSGTLTSRISNDPLQIQEMMGVNMAMVLVAIFSITGCIAIAFAFGWKLTLVAACASLPIICVASFYRIRFEIQFEKLNAAVFAESSQFASEAFGAFRTVASMTLEDTICNRYAALLQDQMVKARRKARFTTLVFSLSDSVALLCMALTFWYGGRLAASFEYDTLSFFVVYIAIIQGSESAGQYCSFGPNMAQAAASANRILSLRNWSKAMKRTSFVEAFGKDSDGGSEVTFTDVHFKYPSRDIPIFAGLNMHIKKGQFVGLVGASGGGKTTVISLLEQFYQVNKGAITLDGTNIKDLDITQYRKGISLVAQEASLFQGTIQENILLAVDEGTVTEEDIYQACRDAEIHDFVMSLPDGYGTDIGSKGIALSGGQKQRIAIARALIRKPRILLLDEATSSLDSESEKLVQAAFERAGKGRTMIVVAHRLATVQNADVIFVLGSSGEGARVLEKGTHAELVAKRGVYYQMCQSQALDR